MLIRKRRGWEIPEREARSQLEQLREALGTLIDRRL